MIVLYAMVVSCVLAILDGREMVILTIAKVIAPTQMVVCVYAILDGEIIEVMKVKSVIDIDECDSAQLILTIATCERHCFDCTRTTHQHKW